MSRKNAIALTRSIGAYRAHLTRLAGVLKTARNPKAKKALAARRSALQRQVATLVSKRDRIAA
jgi:hypothetical protein